MLIDYHVHTAMSDARGEFQDCVKIARRRGLVEIGFSDHFHLRKQEYSMSRAKLTEYVEKVQTLKRNTDFPIKLGLEVDFVPDLQSEHAELVRLKSFDYVIGSVHFIDHWGFDDPGYVAEYQKWNIEELYRTYFSLVQKCAESRLFNIIGHADLIKKFGHRPKSDLTAVYTETVETIKENPVCVEVNTGGLRSPCKEIYPNRTFLEMCFEKGVSITLGSDAHCPEDVGRDFGQASKLIRAVGFEKIVRFTQRKPEPVDL
jgi:histidinol-phosphatase (PHP family)